MGGGTVSALTVAELLEHVQAHGARLVAEGERLRVKAPTPLPAPVLQALKERKADVLQVLRSTPTAPAQDTQGRHVIDAIDAKATAQDPATLHHHLTTLL